MPCLLSENTNHYAGVNILYFEVMFYKDIMLKLRLHIKSTLISNDYWYLTAIYQKRTLMWKGVLEVIVFVRFCNLMMEKKIYHIYCNLTFLNALFACHKYIFIYINFFFSTLIFVDVDGELNMFYIKTHTIKVTIHMTCLIKTFELETFLNK